MIPLHRRLSILMERLIEQGIVVYANRRIRDVLHIDVDSPSNGYKIHIADDVFASVTLAELHFVLFVSAGGLTCGLVAFVAEVVVGRVVPNWFGRRRLREGR